MITIIQNIISNSEIDELLKYYSDNIDRSITYDDPHSAKVYKFKGLSILENKDDFSFIRKLRYHNYDRLRIQEVDNTIDMLIKPHAHTPPYSYIVFLNDDFVGGELILDNITIKPKKGQMVYFDNNEWHYVNNVTEGHRYTLVGFTLDNQFNPNKVNLI